MDPESWLLQTPKHQKRFNVAKSMSRLSTYDGSIKIGAAIVGKHGDVLSVGANQNKSHPLQKQYDVLRKLTDPKKELHHRVHAEIDALVKAKRQDLAGASIYVYRENRVSELAMSRPCQACMAALKDLGVHRIFYTTNLGFAYEEIA